MRRLLLTSAALVCASISCGAQFLPGDTVTLVFAGDIMQHTAQTASALKCGGDSVYDYTSYFRYIRPIIDSADFAAANMEFTVGVRPYTGYPCFSAPEELAAEVSRCGFDLFETANNHICDKGRAGLDSTMAIYERNGWDYTGVYRDGLSEMLDNPYFAEICGLRVAFVNFTYGTNGNRIPAGYLVNVTDTARVAAALGRAREGGAELVVALPHWGTEYSLSPDASQKKWQAFLYSHGADLIIGSHPHVVQPTVTLKDSISGKINHITVFSLGNLISNMSARYTRIGSLAVIRVVKPRNGGEIEILEPEIHYLWCCKAGRLDEGFTTAPTEYLLGEGAERLATGEKARIDDELKGLRSKIENE